MPSSYLALLVSITALTLIHIFPGALAVGGVPLDGDVSLCRPEYGRSLKQQDCKDALRRMPLSDNFGTYTSTRSFPGRTKYLTPLTYESGNCKITVDVASGFVAAGDSYGFRGKPTTMRKLAEHVIAQCLWADTGNGGFVTHGLRSLIIARTSVSPNVGIFLTVTVSSSAVTANPGKTDPAVIERVMVLNDHLRSTTQEARAAELYRLINVDLAQRKAQMTPGGTYGWLASETDVARTETA